MSRIEIDLNRVIKALEYMQEEGYNPERSLCLSYLYDIRDGNVPEDLVSDKADEITKQTKRKYDV